MTTATTTATDSDVGAATERLLEAARTRRPCSPVRDLIGSSDVRAAYAVQSRLAAHRVAGGASVVGRKIGLTSEAVQQQLGVDQPDFGVLFADMAYASGGEVPVSRLLQPRVEAEVAFVLRDDLADGELSLGRIADAVDHVVAAIEICDSRIAGWDISFGDTVADNASAGLFVLGDQRRTLDEVTPRDVAMTMTVTGSETSTGTGTACLGDPLAAVQWLARRARELGDPLLAGQVVLSGALGPMRPVAAGVDVHATITGLGEVSVHFGKD